MRYLLLAGGVGGAKLADGFARVVPPQDLLVCVNTGDDFEHLGLTVCPDLDTVIYTLAGVADPVRGWGLQGETWTFMDQARAIGIEDWFLLGDRDLATHVQRSRMLAQGYSLTQATDWLRAALGVRVAVIPMSEDKVRTVLETDEGRLDFQHYFVRERCRPYVRSIRFEGITAAAANSRLIEALRGPGLEAIFLAPSNPFLSLDPIFGLPGVLEAIGRSGAKVLGVSPIVGGRALKGPAAKIMAELGHEPSPVTVAAHYGDLLDGFVIDESDAGLAAAMPASGPAVRAMKSVMVSAEDRAGLARAMLGFLAELGQEKRRARHAG